MSRLMPVECPHGRIFDWGDFGPEDDDCLLGPHGEHCERCHWCFCKKCVCRHGCRKELV